MAAVLEPYVIHRDGELRRVRSGDGEADIYLSDDGMLANHVTGRDPWSPLVSGAQAANWVILPLDCPTCLTGPGQADELPEGLDAVTTLVETGADLLAIVQSH